jgi:integrase
VDFDTGLIQVRHSLKKISGKLVLGDLKTVASRRNPVMPKAVAAALKAHRKDQLARGTRSADGFVFTTRDGKPCDLESTIQSFRHLCRQAGIGDHWQLRETRHTAVSVLDSKGVPLGAIADLVGHANPRVTATVYRHQITGTISTAAAVWDDIDQGRRDLLVIARLPVRLPGTFPGAGDAAVTSQNTGKTRVTEQHQPQIPNLGRKAA